MDQITNEQHKARRLTAVVVAAHDERACETCRDAVDAYTTAQLAGVDAAGRWPLVAAHMDSCVACAEDYGILYAARLREATLPAVTPPRWSLGFLHQRAPVAREPQRNVIERAVDALRAAVVTAGSQIRITLGDALLQASPLPATAMALRGGETDGTRLVDLQFAHPSAEVEQVRVSAYAQSGAPDRASVIVGCDLHERGWPDLEGIAVALVVDDVTMYATTNPFGEATFDDVPTAALARLQIELDTGAPTTT